MNPKKNSCFFIQGIVNLWKLLETDHKKIRFLFSIVVLIEILQLVFSVSLKYVFDGLSKNFPQDLIFIKWNQTNFVFSAIVMMVVIKFIYVLAEKIYFERHMKEYLVDLENTWPIKAQSKLLSLSPNFHSQTHTALKVDSIHRGCNAIVELIENLVRTMLISALFLFIHGFVMFYFDYRLALLFFLPMIPAAKYMMSQYRAVIPLWETWGEYHGQATAIFYQSLTNIQTVQSFHQEQKEIASLNELHKKMNLLEKQINKILRRNQFIVHGSLALTYSLTLALGATFVLMGKTSTGNLVFLISLASGATQSLWQLTSSYMNSFKHLLAIEDLVSYFKEPSEDSSCGATLNLAPANHQLTIENLSFKYPGKKYVLKNVNLSIVPKSITCFVGPSGEGKSTILKLVQRSLAPTIGKITLDNNEVSVLNITDYRKLFAVVSQDVEIFDRTLLENVTYGFPTATVEQIQLAMIQANLWEIINDKKRFPLGINSPVGERGQLLSGGERQRVGLARAFLAVMSGAQILILDEATSQLDSASETIILKNIDQMRKQKSLTVLMIAHRPSAIESADYLIKLENGNLLHMPNTKFIYANTHL